MRSHDRYLLCVPVRLTIGESAGSLLGNTMDMNEHGVRIRFDAVPDPELLRDQDVVVEIETVDGWVRFDGCVRRISGADVGVRFYSDVGLAPSGRKLSADELIPISAPAI